MLYIYILYIYAYNYQVVCSTLLEIRRCSTGRFSRTQAAPFVGMEDPGSPSERIASSFTGSASKLTWKPCQVPAGVEVET